MDINAYNTRVRQAISDAYVTCSKEKIEREKEHLAIIERLQNEKFTLPYHDYMALKEMALRLTDEIFILSIQKDIWDQAREICLNIADEAKGE